MTDDCTVITGLGMVTPLGVGTEQTWAGLCAGRSAITLARGLKPSAATLKTHIAGQVRDEDLNPYLKAHYPSRVLKRSGRFTHLGLAAAQIALDDSGLDLKVEDPERVGVIMGTGIGGMAVVAAEVQGTRNRRLERMQDCMPDVDTFIVLRSMANACAAHISMLYGLKGPGISVASSCSSGSVALSLAHDALKLQKADIVLAGGTDAAVDEFMLVGFTKLTALSSRSHDPTRASRPFDRERDGFVLAEGAAVLVLEREDHARRRGARIYARLLGAAVVSDAFNLTAPDVDSMARVMTKAMHDGRVSPADVEYISAHGTSTRANDSAETAAIKRALGHCAKDVWVSSQKSMIGHSIGAAGAIEAGVTALSIARDVVTPTINYEHPDPECDLDCVPNVARERKLRVALSNSFGFGGHSVALVLGRADNGHW